MHQVPDTEPAIVPIRVEPESSGPITSLEEAAAIGDAIGIITLEVSLQLEVTALEVASMVAYHSRIRSCSKCFNLTVSGRD